MNKQRKITNLEEIILLALFVKNKLFSKSKSNISTLKPSFF